MQYILFFKKIMESVFILRLKETMLRIYFSVDGGQIVKISSLFMKFIMSYILSMNICPYSEL